jgi:CRP-like cAMP-binding protein
MTEEQLAAAWAAALAKPEPAKVDQRKVTPTADIVLELLRKHPSGLTASDIANKTGLTRFSVCRVMQRLRDKVKVTTVKQIMIYEAAQ